MLLFLLLFIHCSYVDVCVGLAVKTVDLTYNFNNQTPNFPIFTVFNSYNKSTLQFENVTFRVQDYSASEHSGTHMDAPYHFNVDGLTMEEVPVDLFEGPGVVIDISSRANLNNRDAQVTFKDIKYWEAKNGAIEPGSVVVMYSGWGKYATNASLYSGADSEGLHFPGFSAEACEFLLNKRKIRTFAVDTLSVDFGASTTASCHVAICGQNGVIIENLANVEKMPLKGSYIRAFPMKIEGGTGAPVRVIATITSGYKNT